MSQHPLLDKTTNVDHNGSDVADLESLRHSPTRCDGFVDFSGTSFSSNLSSSASERTPTSSKPERHPGRAVFLTAAAVFFVLLFFGGVGLAVLLGSFDDDQEASFFLVWGSFVSLAATLVVKLQHCSSVSSRRHPAPIIYFRACANCLYALTMIGANVGGLLSFERVNCGGLSGRVVSGLVEFTSLASEGWFLVLIVDLLTSLTDPFADYRANMRRYHGAVWGLGLAGCVALLSSSCHGELTSGVCWVKAPAQLSSSSSSRSEEWVFLRAWLGDPCAWSLYLAWVLAFYGYGCAQLLHAQVRLLGPKNKASGAIQETRATRRRVVSYTLHALYLYVFYMAVQVLAATLLVATLDACVFNKPPPSSEQGGDDGHHDDGESQRWAKHALAFLFSARGYVDATVWVSFQRDTEFGTRVLLGGRNRNRRTPTSTATRTASHVNPSLHPPRPQSSSSSSSSSSASVPSFQKGNGNGVGGGGDMSAEELDLDLSPQLNPVLRSEVVFNVTSGIRIAVEAYHRTTSTSSASATRAEAEVLFPPTATNAALSASAAPEETAADKEYVDFVVGGDGSSKGSRFRDHFPAHFASLRRLSNGESGGRVSDEDYAREVEAISEERLSEGASGAFMFFSKNGRFIIKTLKRSEAHTLHKGLEEQQRYLSAHPDSLLTRYFGSHSLRIYNQEFHFIVMQNVFHLSRPINARYDVKGSWVNRSALTDHHFGSRVRCRHCRAPFVVGRGGQACSRGGRMTHEPDVVLKDNDLAHKIRLRPEHATSLISRLEADAEFLCSQGVMDYSLLIGQHDVPFNVNPKQTLKKRDDIRRRESTSPSSRLLNRHHHAFSSSSTKAAAPRSSNGLQFHRSQSSPPLTTTTMMMLPAERDDDEDARSSLSTSVTVGLDSVAAAAREQRRQCKKGDDENDGEAKEAKFSLSFNTGAVFASATRDDGDDGGDDDDGGATTNGAYLSGSSNASNVSSALNVLPVKVTDFPHAHTEQFFQAPDEYLFDHAQDDAAASYGGCGNKAPLASLSWPSSPRVDDGNVDRRPRNMPARPLNRDGDNKDEGNNGGGVKAQSVRDINDGDGDGCGDGGGSEFTSHVFQARVVVGPGLYYVGIVDTLQTWSLSKRLERWLKVTFLLPAAEVDGVSCVPPGFYAARFKRKVRDIVDHDFIRQIPSLPSS